MTTERLFNTLDIKTPLNQQLSGFYERSFAYHTVKERLPIIITQTIDSMVRNKDIIKEQYGPPGQEDSKVIIGKLSELKYEIQTNKPIPLLQSTDEIAQFYNEYLTKESNQNGGCSYFGAVWLHTECYMYRRIREMFELSNTLTEYDPFRSKKEESTLASQELFVSLGDNLLKVVNSDKYDKKKEFINLLKLNLWGNKCDLSLSNGVVTKMESLSAIESLNENILCDQSEAVWKLASEYSTESIVDIILDNAGYELFTDLCLADFLITSSLTSRVRFHVKCMPWFVSDVTLPDFHWLLEYLSQQTEQPTLQTLADRWKARLTANSWILTENPFWTLPVDFSQMSQVAPDLYKTLGEAKLIIFKGDLNYRKLFGERNWDYKVSVEKGLQGFHPAPLCTLRTLKADIVCGLSEEAIKRVEEEEDWMITGNYGVIQCCDRTVRL